MITATYSIISCLMHNGAPTAKLLLGRKQRTWLSSAKYRFERYKRKYTRHSDRGTPLLELNCQHMLLTRETYHQVMNVSCAGTVNTGCSPENPTTKQRTRPVQELSTPAAHYRNLPPSNERVLHRNRQHLLRYYTYLLLIQFTYNYTLCMVDVRNPYL